MDRLSSCEVANGGSPRIRNPAFPLDVVDKLEEATMANVDAYMTKKIAAAKNNNCTLENAAVRREWSVFSSLAIFATPQP